MIGPSWRDHDDRPIGTPAAPGPDAPPFYRPVGDFQGATYRRNAFASGTEAELDVLLELLEVVPGARVLDIGCGDARHLRALARRQPVHATGVDASPGLVEAARAAASADGVAVDVEVGDARRLADHLGERHGTFDVAWSLCQGGLGTSPATDPDVVAGLAGAVRPGGQVAVTVFHALFAARHLDPGDTFDTVGLVHHHVAEVHGPDDERRDFPLWTATYTVREATRLLADAGLTVTSLRGVAAGAYDRRAAGEVALDDPELLLVARRPT